MSEWNRRNIDPNTTNGVWDLHEEATELLLAIYEEIYEEGGYDHSLRLQDVFHALRNVLLWCESIEEFHSLKSGAKFERINPDSNETHVKSIDDLYIGSTNLLMERELREEEGIEGGGFGLLPDNYTVPCVSVSGDAVLWEKRWKKRVLLYQKHLGIVASVGKKQKRELNQDERKKFSSAMGLYQRSLLLLWDMDRYTDPLNPLNREFDKTVPMEGKIRYHLPTGHIYYGHKLVSRPKAYSQEWAVWRKLYDSKSNPRRAKYSLLETMERPDGGKIFPQKIGEKITTLIHRWNRPFKPHKIAPLHYEPFAIIFRLDGIIKPK